MITTDINTAGLVEFNAKHKPDQRCKATFPLFGAHGTSASATVYFELSPGDELGYHTDSAEELLFVLQGRVEATIGEESEVLSQGQIAVVPAMVRHNLKNAGSETAKVLGFFGGANHIVATFEEVWLPTETNIVDTTKLV